MGESSKKPEYSGMDKYPGWIATVITIIIGVVFVGALVQEGSHDAHHGAEQGADHGDAHEASPADKGAVPAEKKEGH